MVVLVVGGGMRERNRKQDKNESREPEDFVEESGGMMMRKIAITSTGMSRVEKAAEYISFWWMHTAGTNIYLYMYLPTKLPFYIHARSESG